MIEIKNLTKRYGGHMALNDVSFTVNKGEIVGFLGPNGAGKSTTMNIITGYIAATDGVVTIDGADIVNEPKRAKKNIGYLPENPPLYMEMTVIEYLRFVYDLKKGGNIAKGKEPNRANRDEHLTSIMDLVGISDVKERVIKNLSKGYKQRVGLAQAMVGNPEVLILDEPTVGLDPNQIIEIRNVIKNLGSEHTVILSTHILTEVSSVCDRIIIINKGNIAAEGTPQSLAENMEAGKRLLARVEGEIEKIIEAVSSIEGVKSVENDGSREEGTYDVLIQTEDGVDIRKELARTLVQNDMTVLILKDINVSLEDIFSQLTTDDDKTSNNNFENEEAVSGEDETEVYNEYETNNNEADEETEDSFEDREEDIQ